MECPTDKPYDYNGSCHKCAQGQYEYVGNCELPEDIPVIPATEGIYWDCDAPADCSSSICGQVSVSCTFIPDNGHTKTVMKLCVNHTNDGCCRGSENFNNERGCNLTSSDGFRLKREGWDQWVGYKDSDSAKKVLNLRSQDASDSYNITLGEIMSMSDDTLGYKVVGTAWEEWNADYVALNGSDGNKFTSNSFVDSNNDSMSPVKRGALFRIRSTKSGYTSYWQHYTNGVIGSEFIMFDGGNEDLFFRLCTNNGCCFQDSCN